MPRLLAVAEMKEQTQIDRILGPRQRGLAGKLKNSKTN
jgi:hypothetical protein